MFTIGYYRVNYETENWELIARYLNSDNENYKNIHILNRAQIIDDAYYFVKEGKLDLSVFIQIINYLSRETEYEVWYSVFKILEDMSTIFLFTNERVNHLKVFFSQSQ